MAVPQQSADDTSACPGVNQFHLKPSITANRSEVWPMDKGDVAASRPHFHDSRHDTHTHTQKKKKKKIHDAVDPKDTTRHGLPTPTWSALSLPLSLSFNDRPASGQFLARLRSSQQKNSQTLRLSMKYGHQGRRFNGPAQ